MIKRITERRLLNITLYYLSRYESTESKVRLMLDRRIKRMELRGEEIPKDVPVWIQNVIQKVKKDSYLNDERYAATQMRGMIAQGKSERHIKGKLLQAGIQEDTIQKLLDETEITPLDLAKRFAEKKHIGPYRPQKDRELFKEKDMGTLARAGFSYDVVKEVLDLDFED